MHLNKVICVYKLEMESIFLQISLDLIDLRVSYLFGSVGGTELHGKVN